MDEPQVGNSRRAVDLVIDQTKEHPEFLQWDREINAKLYYPLWILFMGGFVISIGYTNQPDLFTNCLIRPLLHTFRILAVLGSALNFIVQSRAIDSVRKARELSIQVNLYRAFADDKKSEDAGISLERANKLNGKLIAEHALNSKLESALIFCAAIFLLCSLFITWNIIPTVSPK